MSSIVLPIPATWERVQSVIANFPDLTEEIKQMIQDREIVVEGVKNDNEK